MLLLVPLYLCKNSKNRDSFLSFFPCLSRYREHVSKSVHTNIQSHESTLTITPHNSHITSIHSPIRIRKQSVGGSITELFFESKNSFVYPSVIKRYWSQK
eukprot:TRINITY_DN10466_c0_g1_i5.p1 TRINITY_DN10466_c0_g1~~TRINITY_DN10466_c0_g1_i5.p1  ORF type:complete len:100 (+),score=7.99 TRINITY_DN10466_c0_g1_i5:75-374(+)